jgi:5-methylcytosine-specific restriction protein A
MPRAAARLCSRPWCNKVNCAEHRRAPDSRAGSTARGYGSLWQRLSKLVLIEEPFCRICEREGRITRSTIPDHIVPLAYGGQTVRSNLQGSCVSCNTRKGNKIPGDYGWRVSFWPPPMEIKR